MKVTLEDALSLLGKYVDERTPVLAVFVTPSVINPDTRAIDTEGVDMVCSTKSSSAFGLRVYRCGCGWSAPDRCQSPEYQD
jgi:hypothetical protein